MPTNEETDNERMYAIEYSRGGKLINRFIELTKSEVLMHVKAAETALEGIQPPPLVIIVQPERGI